MRLYFLTPLFLIVQFSNGQSSYKPTIVTLDPHIKTFNAASANEIKFLDSTLRLQKADVMTGFATDIKKEFVLDSLFRKFKEESGFFSKLTLAISSGCNLVLYGKSENIFSFPVHQTSDGNLDSLRHIAIAQNVAWVINPKELKIETKDSIKTIQVHMQVFNQKADKILLDKIFISNSTKLNQYLKCQDNTLECCMAELSLEVSDFIAVVIGQNFEYW